LDGEVWCNKIWVFRLGARHKVPLVRQKGKP
jgi:hypothetical protein